jgi:hypothetical protein
VQDRWRFATPRVDVTQLEEPSLIFVMQPTPQTSVGHSFIRVAYQNPPLYNGPYCALMREHLSDVRGDGRPGYLGAASLAHLIVFAIELGLHVETQQDSYEARSVRSHLRPLGAWYSY